MKINNYILFIAKTALFTSLLACSHKKASHIPQNIKSEISIQSDIYPCDTLKKIALQDLKPNTFLKNEKFEIHQKTFEAKKEVQEYRLIFLDLSLQLKTLTYSFDTIIRGCKMRLIVNRTLLRDVNLDLSLIQDLNFFLNDLNQTSCDIRDQFPDENPEDFGDMLFYDEVSIDEKDPGKIKYRIMYHWFSGGGTSMKGEEVYLLTLDQFRKICELPMSAYEERKVIGTLLEEK